MDRDSVPSRITLRERGDTLDEAYLFTKIDRATYERQRDKIRGELALAELELQERTIDEIDLDGVLAFAEHVLTNVSRLWQEASPADKARLQTAMFP